MYSIIYCEYINVCFFFGPSIILPEQKVLIIEKNNILSKFCHNIEYLANNSVYEEEQVV